MKSINENNIVSLQIVKPDFQRKYWELRAGADLHSSIEILKSDALARLEMPQGAFTVKRCGFFKPYVTVRREKYTENEAVAYLNLNDLTRLHIHSHIYFFGICNLWKNHWGWLTDNNQVILRYKPAILGVQRGDVDIAKEIAYLEDLNMMMVLGVYFLVNLEDDINLG